VIPLRLVLRNRLVRRNYLLLLHFSASNTNAALLNSKNRAMVHQCFAAFCCLQQSDLYTAVGVRGCVDLGAVILRDHCEPESGLAEAQVRESGFDDRWFDPDNGLNAKQHSFERRLLCCSLSMALKINAIQAV
jgi:hypothetical protein